MCGQEISFALTKSNKSSVFCVICKKNRRRIQKVGYYQNKYKYKNTRAKKLNSILDSGGLIPIEKCMEELKISKKGLQMMIFNMNKKGERVEKITHEYYFKIQNIK